MDDLKLGFGKTTILNSHTVLENHHQLSRILFDVPDFSFSVSDPVLSVQPLTKISLWPASLLRMQVQDILISWEADWVGKEC